MLIALGVAGILSFLIRKKYRSWAWYRSGKKGFLFFFWSLLFWSILAVLGKEWWILSLNLLFIGGLFMLGNDKLS